MLEAKRHLLLRPHTDVRSTGLGAQSVAFLIRSRKLPQKRLTVLWNCLSPPTDTTVVTSLETAICKLETEFVWVGIALSN